jgi:hypothetical protein
MEEEEWTVILTVSRPLGTPLSSLRTEELRTLILGLISKR